MSLTEERIREIAAENGEFVCRWESRELASALLAAQERVRELETINKRLFAQREKLRQLVGWDEEDLAKVLKGAKKEQVSDSY